MVGWKYSGVAQRAHTDFIESLVGRAVRDRVEEDPKKKTLASARHISHKTPIIFSVVN